MFNTQILPIAQIVISVLLIVAILLQQKGGGLGSAFGGMGGSSYHTKRGFEKVLFVSTIILGILFVLSTVASLILR